jgi:type IV pilus assembly protein PilE
MNADCRKSPLSARRALDSNRSANRGFTLIEIMIVVVIIGVLAAIAVTSYEWATIKSRRAAAAGCLQEMAQTMERRRTTTMSYAGAQPACSAGPVALYVMTSAITATTFTFTATPQARQATKDTQCGVLTINQVGTRTEAGSAGNAGECW